MNHKLDFLSIENQNYFNTILENFQDGIYITDNEANTVYLNHSYERISGLSKTEMLGQNMRQLVSKGVISMSGTLSVLETKKNITIEQNFRTGKRALITSMPIYTDDNTKDHIVMVLTIVREITEMYSLRKELSRLSQLNIHYTNEIEKLKKQIIGDIDLIAFDSTYKKTIELSEKVALLNSPILITGELGTGKEKLARYIHNNSPRRKFSFLCVNFSVMSNKNPKEYLFGYIDEKGKYQSGILENLDGGTIYINEFEELPNSIQDEFFSLLKDNVCVLGDGILKSLDIRFIIGSSFSYEELLERKLIDLNILHLFALFPLNLPPLRERKDDIIPLAKYFLDINNSKTKECKFFAEDSYKMLLEYPWPHNVYELKVLVSRAAIMSTSNEILPESLTFTSAIDTSKMISDSNKTLPKLSQAFDLKEEVGKFEAQYMEQAFENFGNIRESAEFLNMDSSTFVRKRQRYIKAGYMKK